MAAPWCDLKAAFGFDGDPADLWEAADRGRLAFPPGWTLEEVDSTGARHVAVVRIDGIPTAADGEAVRREIDRAAP